MSMAREQETEPTIPRSEIERRVARLWEIIGGRDIGGRDVTAVFAIERIEILYFTGTPQDGLVWIPRDGEPLFLVRRDLERARAESPLTRIVPFKRARDIPRILADADLSLGGTVGTSLDVLPVNLFRSLECALGVTIEDVSAEVRWTRAVKSPLERERVHAAGAVAEDVFNRVPTFLRPGKREIDLAADIEAYLLRAGSPSHYRTRTFNLEFSGLCCIAGTSADWRSASNSPNAAGRGPDPAFGQGAGVRPIGCDEPILVDLGTNRLGYYADTTRVYYWGELPRRFTEAHETCETILAEATAELERGTIMSEVYAHAVERAGNAGFADTFMGGSRFLGHGVGLEIDEWPVVAEGFDQPLPDGAVISLEPKIALPGGIVGVETTFVFENGTLSPVVTLPTAPVRLDK